MQYSDLRKDIFENELKPILKNNKVSYIPNGAPSLYHFIHQIGRVAPYEYKATTSTNQNVVSNSWNDAYFGSLATAIQMNGFQGSAKNPSMKKVLQDAVLNVVKNHLPTGVGFINSVEFIAKETDKAGFGKQYSIASKMMQCFSRFYKDMFIYDKIVGSYLKIGPNNNCFTRLQNYEKSFNNALIQPLIVDGRHTICIKCFIQKNSFDINKSYNDYAYLLKRISQSDWEIFVTRRSLDRLLWLKQSTLNLLSESESESESSSGSCSCPTHKTKIADSTMD